MKKRSLWISAIAALAAAAVLAGCGKTTYFAGRNLPPSGLLYRVLIAVQNPGVLSKGTLEIVDGYYDIRYGYTGQPASFSLSGFGGALPISIQNMPEEQEGAVYGAGDGSYTLANYSTERTTGTISGLNGPSSSIFISRNGEWVFAASQQAHVLTVVNHATGASVPLSLPGIYRVSVNPGGSVALAFVQNSDFVYYPRQLTAAQTQAYSGGPSTWPKAAVDCEPQNAPTWCLLQAQSPDHLDATGNYYGTPLAFDRPQKAVFSTDGSTAYIVNCGPECGGTNASVSLLPVAPMIFTLGLPSGQLPTNSALDAPCPSTGSATACTISIPGGATNALVDSSTMYVVGQEKMPDGFWGGHLTVVNLANDTPAAPVSISDGTPGTPSRMVEGDDNTLWIGMIQCTEGERYNNNQPYGCLTMYNTSTQKVALLEPYAGDATGVTAVTGLHKVYAAEGGQVYIYSTSDGKALDNQYVTVTGTAWDVAFMDAHTDADNTVY
ncbi:MAG TPA: hypothetical protein VGR47_02385 [Terracidiphilus sp.]|nr:hypothetical protein [Terracidiphilus sp.]